ncbi:MAG: hypothetical protein QM608_12770 [Caulobacter sp.]
MEPARSDQALKAFLAATVGDPETASPRALMAGVVAFYREVPPTGLPDDPPGDMLLFQYGCYDWGQGETFELDLTRQFSHDDDGGLSQLHATLHFAPDEDLRALGRFDVWCWSPGEAAEILETVLASPALALAEGRPTLRRTFEWGWV